MIYVWILFDVTKIRTLSSAVEHYLHTVGVAGSIPAVSTSFFILLLQRISHLTQTLSAVSTGVFVPLLLLKSIILFDHICRN